jgi:hypothetical protein
MDISGDDAGVWMSYEQLADARHIQRGAARRLAQRHRWRRHTGNDGLARVLVPAEWLPLGDQTPRDIPRDVTRDKPAVPDPVAPDVSGVVTALHGAIDTLRGQLVRADARADELRAERDQARAEATEARQAADTLRKAEAERQARGLLARLRQAWRG